MADLETITEAEYDRWIPPRVALQRLGDINRSNAMEAIQRRLAAGTLRLAASTLRRVPPQNDDDIENFVVLVGERMATHLFDDTFWASGDLTILPDRLRDSSYAHLRVPGNGPTVHIVGVRFDPDGIAEIERQAGIVRTRPIAEVVADALFRPSAGQTVDPGNASPPSTRSPSDPTGDRPRPSDSKLKSWLERHEAKFPGQVHHQLCAAFNASHPNFSVGKRQMYRVMKEVQGALKIGNPRISRPKSGN